MYLLGLYLSVVLVSRVNNEGFVCDTFLLLLFYELFVSHLLYGLLVLFFILMLAYESCFMFIVVSVVLFIQICYIFP